MFLHSCVARLDPDTRYTLRRNTANVMKIGCFSCRACTVQFIFLLYTGNEYVKQESNGSLTKVNLESNEEFPFLRDNAWVSYKQVEQATPRSHEPSSWRVNSPRVSRA